MYEEHFDLKSRPFAAKAEGAGVFVGPQQSKVITSLTKGLGAADAVVTVTGQVGVGKTTIVNRALESISPGRMVAWVGRMQLAPDEVLELLLAGFGIGRNAKGTIQRFATFRRLLAERAAAGSQVAIVVEDAQRLGIDALVELEALTAADTGDSTCANIILMGQRDLNKLLATPELARLHQRNRLRQNIETLGPAETLGYLKHCIRQAGGDYEAIFDGGIAELVYKCSDGVPRIINTVCESAMTTAMDEGLSRVTVPLMQQVAMDAFGYEATQTVPIPPIAEDLAEKITEMMDGESDTPLAVPEEEQPTAIEKQSDENLVDASQNESATGGIAEASTESNEEPDVPAADSEVTEPIAEETDSPDVLLQDDIPENDASTSDIPALIHDTLPNLRTIEAAVKLDSDPDAVAEPIKSPSTEPAKDKQKTAGDSETNTDDDEFNLDAALSVEAEATNVMPGITPNLDQLAADAKKADGLEPVPSQPTENIPTLSNSMRIDVEAEVERAKETETNAETEPKIEATVSPESNKTVSTDDVIEDDIKEAEKIATEQELASAPSFEPAPEPQNPADVDSSSEPKPGHEAIVKLTAAEQATTESTEKEVAPSAEDIKQDDVAPIENAQVVANADPKASDLRESLKAEVEHSPASNADNQSHSSPSAPEPIPAQPNTGTANDIALVEEANVETIPPAFTAEPSSSEPISEQLPDEGSLDGSDAFKDVSNFSESLALVADDAAEKRSLGAPVDSTIAGGMAQTAADKRKPDIDALEAALDAAKKGSFDIDTKTAPVADFDVNAKEPAPSQAENESAKLPEITLDNSLPQVDTDEEELRRVAEQIGAANSLEDINDVMAETIFGCQALDEIAAAVVANPPEDVPTSPVMLEDAEIPNAANDSGAKTEHPGNGADSASKRLEMVNALNSSAGKPEIPVPEKIEMGSGPAGAPDAPPRPKGPQPEPIENQINTSMTQTLKALSSAQAKKLEEPPVETKKSGGLFSRFRKSS